MEMSAPVPSVDAAPFLRAQSWVARAWECTTSPRFGDAVIVAFFLAQALDGVFTYIGVATMGRDVEANPLLHWLMGATGHGLALAIAKFSAAGFGIVLHLTRVHRAVALLTLLYLAVAIVPWVAVLTYAMRHGIF
jgi:uncharacterized membrane protein